MWILISWSFDQAPYYKTCFILNSTEHEISAAHETKMLKKYFFLASKLSEAVSIMVINVKMQKKKQKKTNKKNKTTTTPPPKKKQQQKNKKQKKTRGLDVQIYPTLDWVSVLKTIINLSYHILVASLTLMALS